MGKVIFGFIFVLGVGAGVFGQAPTPVPLTEKDYLRVGPEPKAGFSYPYYLYVPAAVRAAGKSGAVQTIYVTANNTGKVDDDFAVHEADAVKRIAISNAAAAVLGAAVLVPAFPRPAADWRIYTQALDRDSMVTDRREYRRLDLQMVAMIDHARALMRKEGLRFDKRVLINGFSAQGMFANRFTFLHPDRVKAAAVGSPGGWPMAPVAEFEGKKLRYPIGTADFKEVAGGKFDLKRLRRVPIFVYLGDKDENDSVPFGDSYDDEDKDLIFAAFGATPVSRWEVSKRLYKDAGLNAEFHLYPGVAHTVDDRMRADVRAFLLRNK